MVELWVEGRAVGGSRGISILGIDIGSKAGWRMGSELAGRESRYNGLGIGSGALHRGAWRRI